MSGPLGKWTMLVKGYYLSYIVSGIGLPHIGSVFRPLKVIMFEVCMCVCVGGDQQVHGEDQQASNRPLSARGDRGAPPRDAQGGGWLPLLVSLERGASARKPPL